MNSIDQRRAWGAVASVSAMIFVIVIASCSTKPDKPDKPDEANRESGAYLFWPMMGGVADLDVPRAQAAAAGGAGDAEALLARWALFIKKQTESGKLRYSKADFAELGDIWILLTAMGLSPSGSALKSHEIEDLFALRNLYVDTICIQACASSGLDLTPKGAELLRKAVIETEYSVSTHLFYESLISYLYRRKHSVKLSRLIETVRGQLNATTEGAKMAEYLSPRGGRGR